MSLAPVKIKNRFSALEETNIIDTNGATIYREKIVKIESLIKPTKPSKKRSRKRGFIHGYVYFCHFLNYVIRPLSNREIFIS